MIITRFAPSPTGYLHIGSARVALFNFLYSSKHKGKFFLRIEDTDKARSTPEAVDAIIDGLRWLDIRWDGEIVFQLQRQPRHLEVAQQLIEMGKAYYCYSTQEEIIQFREKNPYKKFISPWRDGKAIAPNTQPVIRLKVDNEQGDIILNDIVQEQVCVNADQLDDMILIRSDGTSTYMFAVVVDDHDMGVNNIIRGDDHLTNTFRQMQIYQALQWPIPLYTHVPLIHNTQGEKLSKRHGAVGLDYYQSAGYLPEAMCNYLLRLGWGGSGDVEIISRNEAIQLFDIHNISKSPARFDLAKLNHLNGYYITRCCDEELMHKVCNSSMMIQYLQKINLDKSIVCDRILRGIHLLKVRAKTLVELSELAKLYVEVHSPLDERSLKILQDKSNISLLSEVAVGLESIEIWNVNNIKDYVIKFSTEFFSNQTEQCTPAKMMQILRAAVIGTFQAPGVYEVMEVLGKKESISRILSALNKV